MGQKKKKKKRDASSPGASPSGAAVASAPSGTGSDDPAFPGNKVLRDRLVFFSVALVGTAMDIVSKYAVFSSLQVKVIQHEGKPLVHYSEETRLIGETLKFHGAMNTGAVFGLFQGQWLFLVIFTLLALGIIGWVLFRSRDTGLTTLIGLGLVCAGAMGNLWDRLLFGGVRDFILFTSPLLETFGLEGGRWPTFNVADVWICVGIPLILLGDILTTREAKARLAAGLEGGAAPR
ncbi:MAG: signal peptidase II [Planctomycetota bacterium]|jgi:signal peptidase II